ncbi:hypothetical protein Taro_031780 [Colocasia esculenta]|uniref:RNase H type-1 domain-containing protein n=1 Tax=Colocasia esculenta TaxID=4460 RepID=A0A843VJN3_COLES|nr:hypothetical protein [Colocasia esculenta]
MGLQLCGLQVWCWLVSTILWPYCVVVERQLDLSSMTARLRVIRNGLTICCNKGILDILVETDSLNLKRIVTGQMHRPWELTCIIQDVVVITKKLKVQIKHVPREANQVAHSLAGYGCSTEHFRCWDSGTDIPHVVKGPYTLIRWRAPHIGSSLSYYKWYNEDRQIVE